MWPDKHDTSPRPLTKLKLQEAWLFPPAWMMDSKCVRLRSLYHKRKPSKPRKDTKPETRLTDGEINFQRKVQSEYGIVHRIPFGCALQNAHPKGIRCTD